MNPALEKMYLYHYFDKRSGPFLSVTAVPQEEGNTILDQMKRERPGSMCARRDADYIAKRRATEAILRQEFTAKGGIVEIESPYYMVVEHSPWLSTWYEQGDYIKIPIEEFDVRKISFTYGDSMPTFSPKVNDGKEYRKHVYTYEEILKIIDKYGLPQEWNDDGTHGPERYIEAHVWSKEPIASIIEGNGNKVSLTYKSGPMSGIDKGIVKHHFELGAGKENFEWS